MLCGQTPRLLKLLFKRPAGTFGTWQTSIKSASSLAGSYSVAIVGAGPTGLTLSILLSQLGIQNVVVERAPMLTDHPQAHYINNRTMEIFRGVQTKGQPTLAQQVAQAGPTLDQWRKFVYCETVTGHIYGEVDHFKGRTSARDAKVSPEGVAHLSQHRLLPLLLQHARASTCGARICFGQRVTRVEQTQRTVTLHLDNEGSEQAGARTVECEYAVVADGAGSRLRGQLGVSLQGEAALQHLLNIHFMSPGLGLLLRDRPAMLYFALGPATVAVLVAHDLERGEFVLQVPIFPPLQGAEDMTQEACLRTVRAALGPAAQPAEVSIRTVRSWVMSAQIADRFQVGRVLLAGDAAHQFPPAGGFGMNTGIQDAHNLAWKLAAVLQGKADAALVQSYEAERRPVAQANAALSVTNWHEAMAVPRALGLDPAAAAGLQSLASSNAAAMLPRGLARSLLEGGLALGRWASGTHGPLRGWRASRLAEIFAGGTSLRLQFPREDLGFCYRTPGCVVTSVQPPAGTLGSRELRDPGVGQKRGDRDSPFLPSAAPGCRLPHCEVEVLTCPGGMGQLCIDSRISLIDLPALAGGAWVLLHCGDVGEVEVATSAAATALRGLGISAAPLLIRVVVSGRHDNGREEVSTLPFCTVLADHDGWQRAMQLECKRAILVRPDGHVAWVFHTEPLAADPRTDAQSNRVFETN